MNSVIDEKVVGSVGSESVCEEFYPDSPYSDVSSVLRFYLEENDKSTPSLAYVAGIVSESYEIFSSLLRKYRSLEAGMQGYIDLYYCDVFDLGKSNVLTIEEAIINRFKELEMACGYAAGRHVLESVKNSGMGLELTKSKDSYKKLIRNLWKQRFNRAEQELAYSIADDYSKRMEEIFGEPIGVYSLKLKEDTLAMEQFRQFYDIIRFWSCKFVVFNHYVVMYLHAYND